jgi:HSP20 family molecular chaperone IbpA
VTLPGFNAKDSEVTTTPSELVIHAAAQRQKEDKEENLVWTEFGSNDVYRRFELPTKIRIDKETAKLEKGILRIAAPFAGRSAAAAA